MSNSAIHTGTDTEITCPDCEGKGALQGFSNGGADLSKHSYGPLPCFRCKGARTVPAAMLEWIAKGKILRMERAKRGETMYQMALRLNVSSARISAREQGKINPDEPL